MTVSNTTNKYQWTGNGVTTSFAFSNIFFATTDLLVTLYNTSTLADVTPAPVLNGAATYDYTITATLNADTGEYPSGTVVFTTAPPSTYRVTIERVVPQTQSVTLIDNSKFPANTVNGALDRLTILSQRNAQLIAQALYYPSSDPTTVTNILPDAGSRASMYLAFDASGNPIASPGTPGSTPISAFWATTVQIATAALSRTALAVPGLGDNNTFTGTNAFTTQSAGNSSTLAATTAFVTAAVGKVYIQTFTATGTYTPHANMVNCIIEAVGGGGGGGGSTLLATAATIGASKAVTIGAAGAAGSSGANNGGAGGDTSVGTLCIGKGGSGGLTTGTGGTGGVAGTGTVTPTGAPGGGGMTIGTSGLTGVSTTVGGSGSFGSGGVPTLTAGVGTGGAASGYGAGGAGAASANAAGAAAGGAGTAGYVKITEFCAS